MKKGEYYGTPGDFVVKILNVYADRCDFMVIEDSKNNPIWKVGTRKFGFHQSSFRSLDFIKHYNTPLWKAINDTTK